MRKYLIALYIRLSLEDSKTESMSIPNQRLPLYALWERTGTAKALKFQT